MRVLVTGGAGFIGSHVVDAYLQAGHEVWILDDLSRGKREHVNPGARFVKMDLRSADVKDVVAEGEFDCINHHAAQIDVRVSVADPIRDTMVNIIGTLNLLEAARLHGLPPLIFASTGGAVYGEQWQFPANEQHPTTPLSPYGVAKRAVEHYLEYYRQVHGLRYAALRYANVYGPRQDPEGEAGVVGIFCGRILRGQRVIIYGNGEQTRDYVYIRDVARANLLALESFFADPPTSLAYPLSNSRRRGATIDESPNAASCRIFNIGTGIETSVNTLAAMLLRATGADSPIVHQPARPGEQNRSAINPALAAQVLGWQPITPLADGLTETLEWFRLQISSQARIHS